MVTRPQPVDFDPSALSELSAVMGAALGEVIELYLEAAPRLLADAGEAAGRGDAGALGQAAHNLKGNSLILGAVALGAACAEVEELAAAGDVAGAGARLPALGSLFAGARTASSPPGRPCFPDEPDRPFCASSGTVEVLADSQFGASPLIP